MRSHVSFHFAELHSRVVTLCTLVWLLERVLVPDMSDQLAGGSERGWARAALVWPYTYRTNIIHNNRHAGSETGHQC